MIDNDGAMQVISYARNAMQSESLSEDEVKVVKAVCLLLALNYLESGAGSRVAQTFAQQPKVNVYWYTD